LREISLRDSLLWCLIFLAFLLAFTILSVVYIQPNCLSMLLKISTSNLTVAVSRISPSMKFDSIMHGIFGFFLGLFTLEPSYVIFSVFTSVLMDLDHVPFLLGLPVPARISHSLVFLSLADLGYLFLFKKKELVVVMTSSFLLHMALDKLNVPLLSPFSLSPYMPNWMRYTFFLLAFCLNLVFIGEPHFRDWILKRLSLRRNPKSSKEIEIKSKSSS